MADLKVPFASTEAAQALAVGQPDWVEDDRLAALEAFVATPVETSSLFVRHVITAGAPVDQVELGKAPSGLPERAAVPEGSSGLVEVRDGVVTRLGLARAAASAGVRLSSIRSALATDPEWARERLSDPDVQHPDKFFQLTRALYRDGVLLEVPDGVGLEGPVRVEAPQPLDKSAALWRMCVKVGAGASAEVDEVHGAAGATAASGPAVVGVASELTLGHEAELNYRAVCNLSMESGVFINRQAHVGPRSKMRWSLANFGGALTKSFVHTQLAGDGSQVVHAEVAFGTGSQRFDLSSFATHRGKNARSDLLARAALRNRSKASVKGMISIENQGTQADSYLGQFALLLDPDAKAVAIPGLEIETSQVTRAKHAASVSQLDAGQLFYLSSRGLDPDGARRLIVEGFLSPAVRGMASESFRESVRSIVAAKWRAA